MVPTRCNNIRGRADRGEMGCGDGDGQPQLQPQPTGSLPSPTVTSRSLCDSAWLIYSHLLPPSPSADTQRSGSPFDVKPIDNCASLSPSQ